MATARNTRARVLQILASALPEVREEFGVISLALFGSVIRDQAGPNSDVDVLVEFARPIGLIRFGQLAAELERRLGRPVDLVEPEALHPALKGRILAEAVRAA